MKTVTREACSTLKMVAGNEEKHPVVIADGIVREWVGFGWIGEEKATEQDFLDYPTVED